MLRLLFILVLLSGAYYAPAQFGYGPEVGIGMSSMKFAPVPGFTTASGSSIFSGRVGAGIDFGMNKHIYLQSGLFFSRKGENRDFSFYKNDSTSERVKQTLYINYAELPVNVIYKTGQQGMGRFFAGLGVTPAYILGGRNQLQASGVSEGTPFTNNFAQQIVYGNPLAVFDIGVNLSAGYELPTGLFFKAYYTAGMKDLGLGDEIDKNRMWGIAAGYYFGKGENINAEADDLIDRTPMPPGAQ